MLGASFASQIGWLYPLAVISALVGVWRRRRAPRTDGLRAGFAMWGVWLATIFFAFSAGSIPHSYYMVALAPAIAALAGTGLVFGSRAYRGGGRTAWALPVSIAASAAWEAWLAYQFPTFRPWLAPATIILSLVAVTVLVVVRLAARRAAGRPGAGLGAGTGPRTASGPGGRLAAVGLVAGSAAMLIAPLTWTASVFDPQYPTGAFASAGPSGGFGGGPGAGGPAGRGRVTRPAGAQGPFGPAVAGGRPGGPGGRGGPGGSGGDRLSTADQELLDYLQKHRDGAKYLLAAAEQGGASTFVLGAGASVLPMGGFSGQVPFPTLAQFQRLVVSGQLHYLLAGGGPGFGGFGPGGAGQNASSSAQISAWAQANCTAVPEGDYSVAASAGGQSEDPNAGGFGGGPGFGRGRGRQLYRCGSA